jgi:hypothetical protein
MFNETSYPGCGLGDAAAVQRRLEAGGRVKQSKLEKFGIVAPPGYATLPAPKVKTKRPVVGSSGGARDQVDDLLIPADSSLVDPGSAAAADSSGGGFDLGGIFSALPWYVWALGAYFLLKKR